MQGTLSQIKVAVGCLISGRRRSTLSSRPRLNVDPLLPIDASVRIFGIRVWLTDIFAYIYINVTAYSKQNSRLKYFSVLEENFFLCLVHNCCLGVVHSFL